MAVESAAPTELHEGTEAESGGGLPQFEFQHWAGQIAYLLILFVILYVLMSRVFGPRIRKVFDEREQTIRQAIDSAKAVQATAAEQAAAAQKALAEARATAQKTASDAKAKASAEAAQREAALEEELSVKQAEAETRIRAARDQAMGELSKVAVDAAQAIVEKLTGAKVSRDVIAKAVASPQV